MPQRPRPQYTSLAYFHLTQPYGITPSMSNRGNPAGDAMAENAFSLLITECHDQHKSASFHEANELIGRFILFCGDERIQQEARPLSLQSPS